MFILFNIYSIKKINTMKHIKLFENFVSEAYGGSGPMIYTSSKGPSMTIKSKSSSLSSDNSDSPSSIPKNSSSKEIEDQKELEKLNLIVNFLEDVEKDEKFKSELSKLEEEAKVDFKENEDRYTKTGKWNNSRQMELKNKWHVKKMDLFNSEFCERNKELEKSNEELFNDISYQIKKIDLSKIEDLKKQIEDLKKMGSTSDTGEENTQADTKKGNKFLSFFKRK